MGIKSTTSLSMIWAILLIFMPTSYANDAVFNKINAPKLFVEMLENDSTGIAQSIEVLEENSNNNSVMTSTTGIDGCGLRTRIVTLTTRSSNPCSTRKLIANSLTTSMILDRQLFDSMRRVGVVYSKTASPHFVNPR